MKCYSFKILVANKKDTSLAELPWEILVAPESIWELCGLLANPWEPLGASGSSHAVGAPSHGLVGGERSEGEEVGTPYRRYPQDFFKLYY